MRKSLFPIVIVLVGMTISAWAQPTVNNVEQQLAWHLKHIQYWKFEYSPDDTTFKTDVNADDSLNGANKMMMAYLADVAAKQPGTLQAPFATLQNTDLKIVSSDDGKLRFYSWDTHTGGSVIYYNNLVQYKTAGGSQATILNDIAKFSGDGPDPGVMFAEMSSFNSSRKKYYIVTYTATAQTNVIKGVRAYYIENDKLVEAPIFSGAYETTSKVEYRYDPSANFNFKKSKEEHTLHIDKQKLYVPEVANDKMTGNYMVYVYDGEKFVYDKNAK